MILILNSEEQAMKVYALVGTSGTGKSHHAMRLARELNIHYVVDDGLLIHAGKKIAGSSAKREASKIAAVKRAIFFYGDHRQEVAEAIQSHHPDSLLLIGTSEDMVIKIAEALGLGGVDEIVMIEEIASADEIKLAQEMRMKHGKHVIPVPSVELKRDFSGYFMDSFKVWVHKLGKPDEIAEKSVVRPTFSYLGRFTISNKALAQIIQFALLGIPAVRRLIRVKLSKEEIGLRIELDLVLYHGSHLIQTAERCQVVVKEHLEAMTQLNILSLDVAIKEMVQEKRQIKRI
jgi:uncharacterized alkaline shock family protein YloU